MDWEFGISRCKAITYWIVLLQNTGNYIQYPVINHNGNEPGKDIYIQNQSLCCTAEINTLLEKTNLKKEKLTDTEKNIAGFLRLGWEMKEMS